MSLNAGPRLVLPDRHDPRLRLGLVIGTLQVLGQTVLGFKVSVAQILVSVAVCAAVEMAILYRRQHALIWPASAILTGNSTAFILRANGTQHGDWWSLNGVEYFVLACLAGLLSKYLVTPGGRQLFNPSNLGLVLVLLAFGPSHVFPQYLWWGPPGPPLVAALAVIVLGGVWVLRPLRMLPMASAFLVVFAGLVGVMAAAGNCFLAVWAPDPVCGHDYWETVAASPELLVFALFMMSDPKTAPRLGSARLIYGAGVAALAAGLISVQEAEFGVKVALLAGLTVVCALVPLIDRISARSGAGLRPAPRLWAGRSAVSLVTAVLIVAAVLPAVVSLGSNPQVLTGDLSPVTFGSTSNQ